MQSTLFIPVNVRSPLIQPNLETNSLGLRWKQNSKRVCSVRETFCSCVQQETSLYFFLNTFQTLQFSKTKIALFWPWSIQGQSSSLLPVTSDLPSGCEQAEMSISTKKHRS